MRGEGDHRLYLHEVYEVEGEHILQGMIRCPRLECQREYPILDGVPYLLAQIRDQLGAQSLGVLLRDDLHPVIESIVGDCCGPGSAYDSVRRHLSHYAVDHWGEFDPDPWPGVGAIGRLMDVVFETQAPRRGGRAVDLGCSVGRSTFELAARTDGLVLGIDLNLSMLRLAAQALRTGQVSYPRRRVGMVFDRRTHPVQVADPERVDFWAADAMALPLVDDIADNVLSLNLLDCVPNPGAHLQSIGTLLNPEGVAWLATPYDWSTGATQVQGWIGGHSQRGDDAGSPVARIRQMLTPAVTGLELVAERDEVPWEVHSYRRSRTLYSCHVMAMRAAASPEG